MEYDLDHYENESVEDIVRLLEKDEVTFSVLLSILKRPCNHTYTNHKNIIICYSSAPYPVWVWYNGNKNDELKSIAECLKNEFPMDKGYHYNLEYELLEDLQEIDDYFKELPVKMGLFSYRLNRIRPFLKKCEGKLSIPQLEDLDMLAEYWQAAVKEMEEFDFTLDQCMDTVLRKIEDGTLHIWINDDEEIVALCDCNGIGKYRKISGVYTLPNHRRKGYALNLVKEVTHSILEDDLIPILYTNSNYEASNACYKKIGYKVEGKLCTVGK